MYSSRTYFILTAFSPLTQRRPNSRTSVGGEESRGGRGGSGGGGGYNGNYNGNYNPDEYYHDYDYYGRNHYGPIPKGPRFMHAPHHEGGR